MKKSVCNKAKRLFAVLMTLVLAVTSANGYSSGASAEEIDDTVSYATVKSVADFRSYIDNEYPYSIQDVITTSWKGDTPVYKVTIPQDGTLLVCCLAEEGYADGYLYTNFSLTSELGKADACESSRDEISSFAVKAGTYYYRASRWNGTDELTVTTFMGFIPGNSSGVTYSETGVQYDKENNVSVVSLESADGLAAYVNDDGEYCSQDTIETDWSGVSETHSFTVEESGWLFFYPLCENDYIDFELFSDKGLTSKLFGEHCLSNTTENPYSCYLNPGTYYYQGSRWNGTKALSFTTYLGFMKDSDRFSVVSNEVSADKSYASVTFNGNGLIRVVPGDYDPTYINSDKFWETKDRANAVEGKTAVIKKNGNYVARLETEDGYYVMVPFTVSGVIEATPTPVPTVSPSPKPSPTLVPTATVKPTTTPDVEKKVYKITVTKKKMTVKVKKKAKIKYSVTKGYTGKVKITTSNKKIATVSSKAVVTGRKKGKCKITLKLSNGKKAVVTVTVK